MLTPVYHNPALPAPEMTIINAALNLLFRTSVQHLTMTQVYKAAGVSKATLYQYFSGKADLSAALLIEEARLRLHEMQALPATPTQEDWAGLLHERLQSPQKQRVLSSLAQVVNDTPDAWPRKTEWQSMEQQVQAMMMDCLHRTTGNQALSTAQLCQRWAMWECSLVGWLHQYRDSAFRDLIGDRKQFVHALAEQGADMLCQSRR